jgi:hypothetical protein
MGKESGELIVGWLTGCLNAATGRHPEKYPRKDQEYAVILRMTLNVQYNRLIRVRLLRRTIPL